MDRTLTSFIRALRNSDVRVSTAETLDALHTVELVGYENRAALKRSLSLVLPKTESEKAAYDTCFDAFFHFQAVDEDGDIHDESLAAVGDSPAGEGEGQGQGEGGGGEANEEVFDEETLEPGDMASAQSRLGQMLMNESKIELSVSMSEAAQTVKLEDIKVFTQKGLYTRRIMEAMGLDGLNKEIIDGESNPSVPHRRLARELRQRREWLRLHVRDYVEQQFLLYADASGKRLREELLKKVKLSNVEKRNFHLIQEVVQRMAKKLAALHSRRKKVMKRGQLNLPKTLRHNMAYDGAIFDLRWKSKKIDRPKVFAICDVSGSVASYARFMLMFLYSLEEVMPKVRAFAFSSDLGEVTDLFEQNSLDEAIAKALRDYSGGSTDYGQALEDFKRNCLNEIDNRTTVIILGDARNNYGDPKTEILKEIYDRAKRLIWLNPEPRNTWGVGDSEMRRYLAYCHQADECNSLMHLERIVGNLLKSVR